MGYKEKIEYIKQVIAQFHDEDPIGAPPVGTKIVGCYNSQDHDNIGMAFVYPPFGYVKKDESFPCQIIGYELLSDGRLILITNSNIGLNIRKCLQDSIDRVFVAVQAINENRPH